LAALHIQQYFMGILQAQLGIIIADGGDSTIRLSLMTMLSVVVMFSRCRRAIPAPNSRAAGEV
jgi:hypothetical protein